MKAASRVEVPAALRAVFRAWEEGGRLPQPSSPWTRVWWRRSFPEQSAWLSTVPDPISRDDATACAIDATTPEGAVRAFIGSMIWGYGLVGYGPWRTLRVLDSNAGSAMRLAEAAEVVEMDGGLAGFRNLAGRPLRYLGVAFGTKYLYFVSRAVAERRGDGDGSQIVPVLDDVVRRWVLAHSGVTLRIDAWRTSDYRRYLTLLDGWGAALGVRRDIVEELVFRSQISRDDSKLWGERWAAEVVESDDTLGDAVDALHQLRESLAALPGTPNALDLAASSLDTISGIIDAHRTP